MPAPTRTPVEPTPTLNLADYLAGEPIAYSHWAIPGRTCEGFIYASDAAANDDVLDAFFNAEGETLRAALLDILKARKLAKYGTAVVLYFPLRTIGAAPQTPPMVERPDF